MPLGVFAYLAVAIVIRRRGLTQESDGKINPSLFDGDGVLATDAARR